MGVDPDADGLSRGERDARRSSTRRTSRSCSSGRSRTTRASIRPTRATFTVTDGTPAARCKLYGDLKATATYAEKTVGFTWSDPAVGPLDADAVDQRGDRRVRVLPGHRDADSRTAAPAAPKAGNALYLLDVDTGQLIGNAAGRRVRRSRAASGSGIRLRRRSATSATAGRTRCRRTRRRPATAAASSSTKAYLGDIDGKYWRFNFTPAGAITREPMVDTAQPIYASSALLFVGSADVYMFFATGSDLLPATAPGGTGTFKLYGLKDNYPVRRDDEVHARPVDRSTNSGGLANGERPSTAPSVAGDIVFYTTTTENATTPCADFSAKLYALTYTGGAAYDSNGNGKIDNNESPIAATMAGRATAPFIVDQHLYFGYDRRERREPSRRSAIRRTSTTASARSACGSCRGERSDSDDRDYVQLRRQGSRRSADLPALPGGSGARQSRSVPQRQVPRSSKVLPLALGVIVLFAGGLWMRSAFRDEPVMQVSTPLRDPLAARRVAPPAAGAACGDGARCRPLLTDARSVAATCVRGGDYATALDQYQAAIEKNPQDAESLSNSGQVLVRMGKVEEAIPYFERAIALIPQRWAYHFNRARALGLLGRMDEAVAGYREAQQLFPNDYATTFNLGLALHRTGDEAGRGGRLQEGDRARPERRDVSHGARHQPRAAAASAGCRGSVRAIPPARAVRAGCGAGPRPHRTAHADRRAADAARFLRRAVSAFPFPAGRRTFCDAPPACFQPHLVFPTT